MINKESLNRLASIAPKVKTPVNYYAGTPPMLEEMPMNILMFHRALHQFNKGAKHHRFLLVLNCKGDGEVLIDDKRFSLKTGSGVLIFPFQHHLFMQYENEISWLKISFELNRYDFLENKRDQIFTLNEDVISLAIQMVNAYDLDNFKKPYDVRKLSCLLGVLLNEVVHQCVSLVHSYQQDVDSQRVLVANHFLDHVVYYVYKNLSSLKRINEIAKHFHCSESHLRALFKQQTKMSLWSYVQNLRIHKVQEYLGSSELSLKEIAEKCGYSSVYVFSNAFKKEMGVSPLQFRQNLKRKKL